VYLRTTEPRRARILARRLTAESDRMLEMIPENTLTPAKARDWLRHVVTEEMARIRRNRDLIFADGGADARADWAMATAWRLLAQRSVNAELEDEDVADLQGQGRSEMDLHQLETTLDMLGQEVRSEPRIRKMARSFRELTGHEGHISAQTLLLLRKLFIEGRAAAWAQAPEDQGMNIAAELAASVAADILNSERNALLEKPSARDGITRAAEPVEAHSPSNLVEDVPDRPTQRPDATEDLRNAPTVVPASPPPPESSSPQDMSAPEFDPDITSVIERLIVQKARAGVSSVTQRQYQSFGSLLTKITGITDVRGIRKPHVARFRDVLQRMPKSWGKSPSDAHATLDDIRCEAAEGGGVDFPWRSRVLRLGSGGTGRTTSAGTAPEASG
jgi:hypothetical protein